jgi:hypothetical protein
VGYDLPIIDPALVGIDAQPVPALRAEKGAAAGAPAAAAADEAGPQPGWFAVSVNWLQDREGKYRYFLDLQPVDWVGYTLPVYHVTFEQANALRRRYGLPELPAEAGAADGAAGNPGVIRSRE